MLAQLYKGVRLFLGLDKPVKVSKEVIDFLDAPHNPGFMGQGPKEKDVGHYDLSATFDEPGAWAALSPEERELAKNGMINTIFQAPPPTDLRVALELNQNPWDGDVERIVDQVRDGFYGRTKPTVLGPTPGFDLRGHRILGAIAVPPVFDTPEELQSYLENKLTPQLVVDNTGKTTDTRTHGVEPALLDPTDNRSLSLDWIMWCANVHNLLPNEVWKIGATSMIDSEFAGKMRENVEILPWEPTNPCKVNIKYHDKVLNPNDPWFEESE